MEESNFVEAMMQMKRQQQQDTSSPMDDPLEQAHFRKIVSSFFFYQFETLRDIALMERDFASMPTW